MFTANTNLLAFNTISSASYLIVAGGGSGGGGTGGGGGAGGVLTGNTALSAATLYPVVVGAGGASAANGVNGNKGSNSVFNGNTALGGGSGGRDQVTAPSTGGSGGGGGLGAVAAGAAGTAGQGFAGGTGGAYSANYPTGGGGGAGNVGLNFSGTTLAGNGGPGISSSITGNVAYYGGGGGGGVYVAGGAGAGYGGIGGGGNAVITTSGIESAGAPYTGGGGGGGVFNNNSGAGATGIVIVRYVGTAPPMAYSLGLAGKWTFEASDATDTSGNGNNGSLVNSPTFGTGHNGTGTAITFPATGYVNVPTSSTIDIINSLSVAFWIKFTSAGNNVILERYNGSNSAYGFQTFPTGIISWLPVGTRIDATGIWNDGKWHHVCGTFQSINTVAKIYIDGVLRNTNNSAAGPTSISAPLTMGSRSGTSGFSGSLDDVYLFNRVLSADEVFGLYQQ